MVRKYRKRSRGLRPTFERFMLPVLMVVLVGGVVAAVKAGRDNAAPMAATLAAFDRQDLVVYAGDSITWGAAASDPEKMSRPALMAQQLGDAASVVNKGVNGWKLVDVAGNIEGVETLARRSGHNVVIVHAGSNDLKQNATADDLYPVIKNYVATLTRQGWRVAVGTVLSRDFNLAQEQQRLRFNDMLRGPELRQLGATILDYASLQRSGSISLADGVHPGDAGYAAMNRLEVPFVSTALKSASRSD